jgi:drug/metabolite transporter (DMT)-like permease
MLMGVLCALLAGLCWGLVFVAPVWLSEYPADILSFGRYLAFGVVALFLGLQAKASLALLKKSDWIEALKLSLIGNIIYYCGIAAAVQWAGAPSTSVLIGTLPVVIAICSNWLAKRVNHSASNNATPSVSWSALIVPLALILLGLAFVNAEEFHRVARSGNRTTYGWGVVAGFVALLAWTWYPIRNAAWIKANPEVSSGTWATAQGLVTLPLALTGYLLSGVWHSASGPGAFAWPLGPTPLKFVLIMLLLGVLASWLGTVLWNRASQLLPATLAGQLIVFETLAALLYAYIVRQQAPEWLTLIGIAVLIIGVLFAVRVFQKPKSVTSHS